jgi:uncharacterized membrane protein YqjE
LEASGTETDYRTNGAQAEEPSIGELVNQISTSASNLIREEIELARSEIEYKIRRLTRGAIVAASAGFFVFLGLIFVFHSLAWGLNDVFGSLWMGYVITTVFLFVVAGIAGLVAARAFKAGAPPTPDTAIEEAKLIRQALEHPDVQAAAARESGEPSRKARTKRFARRGTDESKES